MSSKGRKVRVYLRGEARIRCLVAEGGRGGRAEDRQTAPHCREEEGEEVKGW